MSDSPDLSNSIEVETVDGYRERWSLDEKLAQNRAAAGVFSDRLDEGFATLDVALIRDVMRDWPDLNLLDTIRVLGNADGDVAWEGRHVAKPAGFKPRRGFSVQGTGWASAWTDRTFVDVLADSGGDKWGPPTLNLRSRFITNGHALDAEFTAAVENGALVFSGPKNTNVESGSRAALMYVAPDGVKIAKVAYKLRAQQVSATHYTAQAIYATDDDTQAIASWDDHAVVQGSLEEIELEQPRRFLAVMLNKAPAGNTNEPPHIVWAPICVYSDHGLELFNPGDGQPPGFLVSDALVYLLRYCPALTPGDIAATDWPVPQGAWHQGTTFQAAQTELNDTQLWHPAVWEGRRYDYGPHDLSDDAVDWVVRTDDPGVELNLQGDSIADLRNGLVVEYEDVELGRRRLTPETHPDHLADLSPDNPANRAGLQVWGDSPLTLDYPAKEGQALRVGRVALAELQRPRSPGSITLRLGKIRDRGGTWQPGWRARSGQTITIADHPNPSPRLITEKTMDPKTKSLELTLDRPSRRVEALLAARIGLRRGARGL